MGFWKEPRGLHWTPAPPASCHMRVNGVLTAAVGSGVACLHLLEMLPVCMIVDSNISWLLDDLSYQARRVTLVIKSFKRRQQHRQHRKQTDYPRQGVHRLANTCLNAPCAGVFTRHHEEQAVQACAVHAGAAVSGFTAIHGECAQVRQAAEVTQAALSARARQELALTIARWTAASGTDGVLLKLDAQLPASASNTSFATPVLAKIVALRRLTAKTSIQMTSGAMGGGNSDVAAASKEALGATAAAWSQLPWPVGSTQLLRMAVSAVARVAVLEAMASSADQPAFDAWHTAGGIVGAVTQALQQAGLPVKTLPQAAFCPIMAATLSVDADSHAGRGAVAVATALLIRAAGALQTRRERLAASVADGAISRPTGMAPSSAQRAVRSGDVTGQRANRAGNAPMKGNEQQTSSRRGSSSGSGADSGSSSGTSASSGSTSQSSSDSGSSASTATSGSTGSGGSSDDGQQHQRERRPKSPGGDAEATEPARMLETNPARADHDDAGAETAAPSTAEAATLERSPVLDAGPGGMAPGAGAAESGTEAESGEIGVADAGLKSPVASSASGSSLSSVSSGSSSGSASGSTSSGSSASTSTGSGSSGGSSGGPQRAPARQHGPQTAMEARVAFESVLTGSQDRCAAIAS